MTWTVAGLMQRGCRGELLGDVPFVPILRKNSSVLISAYVAAAFLTLILSVSFSGRSTASVIVTVAICLLWVGVGYIFVAVGTKLAHSIATWGVALAMALISAAGVLSNIAGLAMIQSTNAMFANTGFTLPGTGALIAKTVVSAVACVAAVYLTITMAQAMRAMTPTAPSPGAPGTRPSVSPPWTAQ